MRALAIEIVCDVLRLEPSEACVATLVQARLVPAAAALLKNETDSALKINAIDVLALLSQRGLAQVLIEQGGVSALLQLLRADDTAKHRVVEVLRALTSTHPAQLSHLVETEDLVGVLVGVLFIQIHCTSTMNSGNYMNV